MAGLLSVVSTPIGNLDDFSPRAARILAGADVIACEDTRVTRKLLSRFPSRARLISCHAANEARRAGEIVRMVEAGKHVAVVTDAGTPGLSDPGHRLVAACAEKGLPIDIIPGPSAVTAALVLSGLPTARFVFEGFLPRTASSRRRRLEALRPETRTVVFFEAPHRLIRTLEAMLETLGDRRVAMARELTKIHEEVVRTTLSELAERMKSTGVRGEVTLVVAGREEPEQAEEELDLATLVRARIERGMSRKDAVTDVASETGVSRRTVYQAAIEADSEAAIEADTQAAIESES